VTIGVAAEKRFPGKEKDDLGIGKVVAESISPARKRTTWELAYTHLTNGDFPNWGIENKTDHRWSVLFCHGIERFPCESTIYDLVSLSAVP